MQSDTQVGDSRASAASPAARRVYCCLLPLEVERCLIEGLYNALKRPSTAFRAKVVTLELSRHSPQQKKNKPPALEKARERNAQLLLVLM